MATRHPVDETIAVFLNPLLPPKQPFSHRPFVTVTYAQSLDGKIAGAGGKQVAISCEESKRMTHTLRSRHDGILIGIETLLNDDPLLTARDVPPPPPGVRPFVQPTPIILDAQARFPLDCRLFANFKAGVGKRPWVVCDPGMCKRARRIELEEAGCRILVLNTRGTGIFDLLPLLDRFNTSINHLMVEGGARVLSSFLACPKNVVDLTIITVAPSYIGESGVSVAPTRPGESLPDLIHLKTVQLGRDTVIASKPRFRSSGGAATNAAPDRASQRNLTSY